MTSYVAFNTQQKCRKAKDPVKERRRQEDRNFLTTQSWKSKPIPTSSNPVSRGMQESHTNAMLSNNAPLQPTVQCALVRTGHVKARAARQPTYDALVSRRVKRGKHGKRVIFYWIWKEPDGKGEETHGLQLAPFLQFSRMITAVIPNDRARHNNC